MLEELIEWDREALIFLNGLGVEQYDSFWTLITQIPTWIPLFLLFFLLLLWTHPLKKALILITIVIALLGFVLLATDLTKEWVERVRPNNDVEINHLLRVLKNPTSYSFFSGHAATSFSITTLMVVFLRQRSKWIWLLFIWPILFSLSRIYVGVHYPIDILVGMAAGIFSAFLFYYLYKRFIVPYTG
ncbi:MAG: phosphatase PAP2 family protein [Eudoraea sp.]|nr:phosphatase PAP2 family protein [Eudoraea sp.]